MKEQEIELIDILKSIIMYSSLSEREDEEILLEQFYNMFAALYDDPEYRHSYYEISKFLDDKFPEEVESLSSNIESLLIYADEKYKDKSEHKDIVKKILKLLDHIHLESFRKTRLESIKFQNQKSNEYAKETKKLIKELGDATTNIEKKVKNYHTDTISILGMFAAIIVAFTGGISFANSILDNISEAGIYRTVIVSLILGFVLFNVIYVILKLTTKKVDVQKEKSTAFWIVNIILVLSLLFTTIMWYCGFVESRNKRIEDEYKENTSIQISTQNEVYSSTNALTTNTDEISY